MNESELRDKYPVINIVPKSLKRGRGTTKNQVQVKCRCGEKFPCYTSDLWLRRCPKCGEKINEKPGRKSK